MKILTYFEEIGFSHQRELLALWEKSWRDRGWDPVVLSRSDAEAHAGFTKFVAGIRELHERLMGKPIRPYGLSCYLRWLAYAARGPEGTFFVSDYDVINLSLAPLDPGDGLHLRDDACPCWASGSRADFDRLCSAFLAPFPPASGISASFSHFHDQEFFIRCRPGWIRYSRDRKLLSPPRPGHPATPLHHVSHHACGSEDRRLSVAARLLSMAM